ncbi:MAG: hypothetical protein ACSHX4_04660 [Opitutaceae bacterium]
MSQPTKSSSVSKPSKQKSIFRKLVKISIIGFLLLLAALFLFSSFENWRGSRVWGETKAGLEAKGVTTDWAELIPEPIPEEDNLALSRIMTACYYRKNNNIGDWEAEAIFGEEAEEAAQQTHDLYAPFKLGSREDVFGFPLSETESLDIFGDTHLDRMEALAEIIEPYRPLLEELRLECKQRSDSYLPGDYSLSFASPIPAFKIVRRSVRLLVAEAILALHEGDAGLALENCQAMARVANLNSQSHFLVNQMIEVVVMRNYVSEIVWAGMSQDVFDIEQLEKIEALCANTDLVQRLGHTFQDEVTAGINALLRFAQSPEEVVSEFGSAEEVPLIFSEHELVFKQWMAKLLRQFVPAEGWNLQMLSRYARFMGDYLGTFDLESGTVNLEELKAMSDRRDRIEEAHAFFDNLLLMSVPSYQKVGANTVDGQRRLDLLQIAVNLCLHAKAGNPLPNSLAELEASVGLVVPTDPATQQSYTYTIEANGFTLASAGKDDRLGSPDDLVIHWEPRRE